MSEPQERLILWYENRQVGVLWRPKPTPARPLPDFGFTFDRGWVESNGFRPALHFYVQFEPYSAGAEQVKAFFTNLLPEESARERMATAARVSRADIFGLLAAYGGDCAGAFSLLPEGEEPAQDRGYAPLSDEALRTLIAHRGVVAVEPGDERPRLSLAGAQAKTPVYIDAQGRLSLPLGAAPSSHILKFASETYPHLLLNEYFMLQLARAVGLPVVTAHLRWLDPFHPYLLVDRYDRVQVDGVLRRLHQQDLCQAQDVMDWAKYENRNDPEISQVSFGSCLEAVRDGSARGLRDVLHLVDWQIFNVLTGNSDGHAKNAALVQQTYGTDSWVLAPFYDLICVRVYPQVNHHLALGFGGQFEPTLIDRAAMGIFAAQSRLSAKVVVERMAAMIEAIDQALPQACDAAERAQRDYYSDGAAEMVANVVQEIRALCGRVKRHAL